MSARNENPLAPASWQAGGAEGAGAGTWDRSEEKATQLPCLARLLVLWHIDAAQALLFAYASETDAPEWRTVEAADCLDAAANALAAAECNTLGGNA